ncbi:DUF4892 domain-containing protein [Nitrincola sp. MINF-07-Sa-05]|uniref:DUF4892 domain-containing protein n=1 Tax=Nitrincola salilacus TaxID=3400273 RepID=UPI003917FEE1
MQRYIMRALQITVTLLLINPLGAVVQASLPEWLKPVPLSTLIDRKEAYSEDYVFPLSQISRIQGLVRMENELRVSGNLTRHTYELLGGYTPEQGFSMIREQLLENNAEILFECNSRNCGASNLWANDVFGYATLYGADRTQSYLAASHPDAHIALYTIRRGNGRVYMQLDVVYRDPVEAGGLVEGAAGDVGLEWSELLYERGYAELTDWPGQDTVAIRALQNLLEADVDLNLRLVVHLAGMDVEQSLADAQALAMQIRDQVLQGSAQSDRLQAYGVGALAPSVLAGRDRVLVVISY